ncbi:MAG: response regulator [Candidatus Paceibacterota bacterium]|jgi:CheY-like chemotaxis protein|nr:response regulator [Candidatus Paceibacterota bacterium]MDD4830918.1 response regulator [Candidatus Paceibacterota bacterium]
MKVLIVDDDKFVQAVYKSGFIKERIEVDLAQDGEEGLEKARKALPDLILLDLIMPRLDGFDFLEEAKKDPALKKIPVIVFSVLSQQSDIDKALELGAFKYMAKDIYMPNQIIEEAKKMLFKG